MGTRIAMLEPMLRRSCALALPILVALAVGCAAEDEGPATQEGNITSGEAAPGLPEAVLLEVAADGMSGDCTGAVVSPHVVLTAGHCIDNFTQWTAIAPYAGGQAASSTRAIVYDYDAGTDAHPGVHDLGLVLLDAPIELEAYPTLASEDHVGRDAQFVGRVQEDGEASDTELFISPPSELKDGAAVGWPFTYMTKSYAQPGDSGGPVVLTDDLHTIVGVDSGGNGEVEISTRVHLLHDWITEQIDLHESASATP